MAQVVLNSTLIQEVSKFESVDFFDLSSEAGVPL